MNDRNVSTTSGGIGFVGLLQLLFIALKLMGFISWKWLWVLAPTWIGFIVFVIIIAILVIICNL